MAKDMAWLNIERCDRLRRGSRGVTPRETSSESVIFEQKTSSIDYPTIEAIINRKVGVSGSFVWEKVEKFKGLR